MNPEKFKGIEHIFKGIPEDKFDPTATAQKNLESLHGDFIRLGIDIDLSCNIANSTLKRIIELINTNLSPVRELSPELKTLLGDLKLGESGQRICGDLIESKKKLNFNIKISPGVNIGEGVKLGTSVSIGEQTKIGDKVEFHTGTSIGRHCSEGRNVFFGPDCLIGDNVTIVDSTVFKPKTNVPADSRVVHENDDNMMAKIERRLKIV